MGQGPDLSRPTPAGAQRPAAPTVVPEPVPITVVDEQRFASRWRTIQFGPGPDGHLWREGGRVTVAVEGETVHEGVPLGAEAVRERRPWLGYATGVAALAVVCLVVAVASGSGEVWYWLAGAAGAFAPLAAMPCVRVTYRDGGGQQRSVVVFVRPSRDFRHRRRAEALADAIRRTADAAPDVGADA